ncbi:MAG: M48 family metallopeptidase [Eggerthellaceae bacterium]|jgi:predicted metal-dependent hydrolase
MRIYDIEGVPVMVVRKRIKNLYLRVRPQDGQVIASVPMQLPWDDVEEFLQKKHKWILLHHEQALHSPQRYAEAASADERRAWRAIVQAGTEALVAKWEPVLGVKVQTLVYRSMRSRWGSCQPETGRVCINTRLALYPPRCLEYVVVHELCHLIEPSHGPRFKALLNEFLPDWKSADALLKK